MFLESEQFSRYRNTERNFGVTRKVFTRKMLLEVIITLFRAIID